MSNKYLYMALGGIGMVVWFVVGMSSTFGNGDLSKSWWLATIVAVGLGAGNSSGDNALSVFIGAIKDFIPQLIVLVVANIIGGLVFQLVIEGSGYNVMRSLNTVLTYLAAATLTSIFMSYLKKSL